MFQTALQSTGGVGSALAHRAVLGYSLAGVGAAAVMFPAVGSTTGRPSAGRETRRRPPL